MLKVVRARPDRTYDGPSGVSSEIGG
ncbi:hypothetical protein VA596_15620 [Amycolatopsis sp., V23-08]|uniref:Uncharacterized protein n=1 Tax=Amycolatopsis heterodermiae TaxID=3110235 RepID=A0ABU5R439_9PSEU|nr:hypothetical protein [Amycolatopsis sp., V23-08]MEA5360975.1 hypothetical protein [Amycolatopsis sp., V23-08]